MAEQQPTPSAVLVPRAAFDALVKVAAHVSYGRRAAFSQGPYPDAGARIALGALHDAGLLPEPVDCARCGELDHCACWHDACCTCGSKEHAACGIHPAASGRMAHGPRCPVCVVAVTAAYAGRGRP